MYGAEALRHIPPTPPPRAALLPEMGQGQTPSEARGPQDPWSWEGTVEGPVPERHSQVAIWQLSLSGCKDVPNGAFSPAFACPKPPCGSLPGLRLFFPERLLLSSREGPARQGEAGSHIKQ